MITYPRKRDTQRKTLRAYLNSYSVVYILSFLTECVPRRENKAPAFNLSKSVSFYAKSVLAGTIRPSPLRYPFPQNPEPRNLVVIRDEGRRNVI